MKSKFSATTDSSIQSPNRNPSSSQAPQQGDSSAKRPQIGGAAVPITIYRELVAELQHTQKCLREVSDRNGQLTEQNQKLRNEVEQLIYAALHLRSVANTIQPDAPIVPDLLLQGGGSDKNKDERTEKENLVISKPGEEQFSNNISSNPKQFDELNELLETAIHHQDNKQAASATQNSPSSSADTSVVTASQHQQSVSIETPEGAVTLKLPTLHQTTTIDPNIPTRGIRGHRSSQSKAMDSSWWLTVIIILVVVSAFGAGFMAMLFFQGQRGSAPNS